MTALRHLNLNKSYIELLEAIKDNDGVECEQVPEIFFPDSHESRSYYPGVRLAKEICYRCPVIDLCGKYAIEAQEPYGIWGSYTADERRSLTRRV